MKYIVLIGCCVASLLPSCTTATVLTSTHYTLHTEGVGETSGNVLTSEHYSVIPKQSNVYASGDTTSEEENDEDTREETHRGGKHTRIETVPSNTNPLEIIFGSDNESREVIKSAFAISHSGRENDADEKFSENTNTTTRQTDAFRDEISQRNTASVIEAFLNGHLRNLFETRTSRVVVLVCVLLFLWYVRTYTELGERYRPF